MAHVYSKICYTTGMSKEQIRKKIIEAMQLPPVRGKIRRVALFGSYLHGNAKPESDVDLLIELDETIGALEFVSIERFLSKHVGKKVDLVEPDALSEYCREEVLNEAESLYTA